MEKEREREGGKEGEKGRDRERKSSFISWFTFQMIAAASQVWTRLKSGSSIPSVSPMWLAAGAFGSPSEASPGTRAGSWLLQDWN